MNDTRSSPTAVHLAADAGGSSTRAVVVDETGACLGYGLSGSGNPTASGISAASAAIIGASTDALRGGEIKPSRVASVSVAMAGGRTGSDGWLQAATAAAGLSGPARIESDLLACYLSGSLADDGYAVVAGTGAIALRLEGGRVAAARDGLGWLVGDAGSGFWVGHRVVRAVAAALDSSILGTPAGSATSLTRLLLDQLGIDAGDERDSTTRPVALVALVQTLYRRPPVDLARYARLAFQAAGSGDQVAAAIVAEAADALAATVSGVATAGVDGPVVLGGSLLANQPALAARVAGALYALGIHAPAITVADGTVGAAVLALRAAGVVVDGAVHRRITGTLAALRPPVNTG